MFPPVPHSLRTDSILANGVVIIHYKQSTFLLHDCEEALVRTQDSQSCILRAFFR